MRDNDVVSINVSHEVNHMGPITLAQAPIERERETRRWLSSYPISTLREAYNKPHFSEAERRIIAELTTEPFRT